MKRKKNENSLKTAFKEILNGDIGGDNYKVDENSGNSNEINLLPEKMLIEKTNSINSLQESIIASDMIIEGNIKSSSKIIISGQIKGNVTSQSDIIITGKVEGDILSDNISLNDSSVIGNINTSAKLFINEKSILKGDVKSIDMICHGVVNGNINVENLVELASTASVIGDISAKSIRIHENATIKGILDISPKDYEKGSVGAVP